MIKRLRNFKGKDYILIVLSTFIMSFSVNLIFEAASMVPGGITGLAMMVNRFSKAFLPFTISTGVATFIFNIPLLIAAIKIRGLRFMKKTIVGSVSYSLWLIVLPHSTVAQNDLLITALAGGTMMGIGMGIILLGKGTTGGTDTLAALIQKKLPFLSTTSIYPVIDGTIIILAIWVFGVIPSLYAVLSVVVSGRIANWVQSGIRGHVNQAFIVTLKYKEMSQEIYNRIHRGTTLIHADGMYSHEKRPMLLCAVAKRQTADLRQLVFEIDPKAFMIISNAKDIRGTGFASSTEEVL